MPRSKEEEIRSCKPTLATRNKDLQSPAEAQAIQRQNPPKGKTKAPPHSQIGREILTSPVAHRQSCLHQRASRGGTKASYNHHSTTRKGQEETYPPPKLLLRSGVVVTATNSKCPLEEQEHRRDHRNTRRLRMSMGRVWFGWSVWALKTETRT